MYVCHGMYMYMYVSMYVYYEATNVYARMHVCIYENEVDVMMKCKYVCVYMYTYMYVYVCIYVCVL
jgi:hypothetical protein